MWMHTLLNQLQPLQQETLAPHEIEYGDLQRWHRRRRAGTPLIRVADYLQLLEASTYRGDRVR